MDYRKIQPDEKRIVAHLRQTMELATILSEIEREEIIAAIAEDRGIEVTEEEVRFEAKSAIARLGLDETDKQKWFAEERIFEEDYFNQVCARLLEEKVRDSFEGSVREHFERFRECWNEMVVYRIIVPYEHTANEIVRNVKSGQIQSFQYAAHLYDLNGDRKKVCGYEGTFYAYQLPGWISDDPAQYPGEGEIAVSPIGEFVQLVLVDRLIEARLNEETEMEIKRQLLEEEVKSRTTSKNLRDTASYIQAGCI